MISSLEQNFKKIGAEVKIVNVSTRRRWVVQPSPITLDVITNKGKELFEISIRDDVAEQIDLSVLEVIKEERHLVLLAKQFDHKGDVVSKDHFLCGHDERHFFVASVGHVSTVAAAKDSLKPQEIRDNEAGLDTQKRNRRKTPVFKRQGEWFFVPVNITPEPYEIRKYEPLVRGGSKAHIAQFACRRGGEPVKVCSQFPNGLTLTEFSEFTAKNPAAKYWIWRSMQRNATVYVMGQIRHPDHATVVLNSWHRVLMNTETERPRSGVVAVAFLD
jgi:hypothetical protein